LEKAISNQTELAGKTVDLNASHLQAMAVAAFGSEQTEALVHESEMVDGRR
jgi:hypothetical protein